MKISEKIIVLLPALNEIENLENLYIGIKKLNKDIDTLIIDDGSTDGTLEIINKIKNDNPSKNFQILRGERKGIGSAHIDGLNWCYNKNYDYVITMDTDFAHHPNYIVEILKLRNKFDLVLGSRFMDKGGAPEWSIFRKFVSRSSHFISLILFKHNYDSTNSFRCYNLKK